MLFYGSRIKYGMTKSFYGNIILANLMLKRLLFLFAIISIALIFNITPVFAQRSPGRPHDACDTPNISNECCRERLPTDCIIDGSWQCLPWPQDGGGYTKGQMVCQEAPVGKVFGKIKVPDTLGGLIKNNPTGAGAISQFLTNFIALIYVVAAIVLIFMLVWAAFEWLTSGGDKEKIASAQKRILHAIIGIILLAVAFAIIRILGVFTGFTFFKEPPVIPQPLGPAYLRPR